jgi:hypothetical protein
MCPLPVHNVRGLGLLLGVVVAATAHGQSITVARVAQPKAPPPKAEPAPPPASVHRLVVYEGANRRVHYIPASNVSTADRLAAYELERTENALTYYHDLQRLKQQYVNSERILEPRRRYVQEQLYGTQIRYGGSSAIYGGADYGWGYPYFWGGWGYSPYFWGGYGYPQSFAGYTGATSYQVAHSLQFGMGDEGRFKDVMVQAIAQDSSPDRGALVLREYEAAAARAAASPVLSRDLGLQKGPPPPESREPSFAKGSKVTLWVGNDKYTGTVKEDRPGWVVIQTDKAEVTVRKAEILRSEVPAKPKEQ